MSKKNYFILDVGTKRINFKKNEVIKICLTLEEIAYAISSEQAFDILDFYIMIPFKGAKENFRIYLCRFMEKYLNNSSTKNIIINYMKKNDLLDKKKDKKIMQPIEDMKENDIILEYIYKEKLPITYGVYDIVNSFYNGEKINLKEERIKSMNNIKNKNISSKKNKRLLKKIN